MVLGVMDFLYVQEIGHLIHVTLKFHGKFDAKN